MPDLILINAIMPVMDGYEAVQSEILEIKEKCSNSDESLLVKMVGDQLSALKRKLMDIPGLYFRGT